MQYEFKLQLNEQSSKASKPPDNERESTAPTLTDIRRKEKIVRGLMPSLQVIKYSSSGRTFESGMTHQMIMENSSVSELFSDDTIFLCYRQAVENLADNEDQLESARLAWLKVCHIKEHALKYEKSLINFLNVYDSFIANAVIPLVQHIETLLKKVNPDSEQKTRMQILSDLIRARKYTKFLPVPWRDYAQKLCDKTSVQNIDEAHSYAAQDGNCRLPGANSSKISSASQAKKRKLSWRVGVYDSLTSWIKGFFKRFFLPVHLRVQLDLVKARALSEQDATKLYSKIYAKIGDAEMECSEGIKQFVQIVQIVQNPKATYIVVEKNSSQQIKAQNNPITVGEFVPKDNNIKILNTKLKPHNEMEDHAKLQHQPEYQVMKAAFKIS